MKKSGKKYFFMLFISGTTPQSQKAISSVRKMLEGHLHGEYELEVIDVYQNPDRAKEEQIIAVPTLVKRTPAPLRKFIGDLSDEKKIIEGMGARMKKAKSK
jgi:circadian clock protein KaiB